MNLSNAYWEAAEVHSQHLSLGTGTDGPGYGAGYFAILSKTAAGGKAQQRMYALSDLERVTMAARSAPDTYYSQASFFTKTSRRATCVSQIGCSFVDIDCYKAELKADDALLQTILQRARGLGLVEPSYVVSSGRGLYLKWLFTRPLGAAQIDRWTRLQSILVPLYRSLGADMAVRDPSRVLRIIDSVNSSADGAVVNILWNSGRRVDFEQLWKSACSLDFDALDNITDQSQIKTSGKKSKKRIQKSSPNPTSLILPGDDDLVLNAAEQHAAENETSGHLSASSLVKRRVKKAILESLSPEQQAAFVNQSERLMHEYSASHEPIMLGASKNLSTLNWARFIDLRDLCLMRGGPRRGSRDLILFWMMNFLGLSGAVNAGSLDMEVMHLIRGFEGVFEDFDPIRDGSLETLRQRMGLRQQGLKVKFKDVSYDPLYTPTNEHLIEIFDITEQEQIRLSTIIDAKEKLRRADEKVPGRHDRRQKRQESRAAVVELLHAQSDTKTRMLTQSEMADKLGVSRHQVGRWIREFKNSQSGAVLHHDDGQISTEINPPAHDPGGSEAPFSPSTGSAAIIALTQARLSRTATIASRKNSPTGDLANRQTSPSQMPSPAECAVFALSRGGKREAAEEEGEKKEISQPMIDNHQYLNTLGQVINFGAKVSKNPPAPEDVGRDEDVGVACEGGCPIAEPGDEKKFTSTATDSVIEFATRAGWKANIVLGDGMSSGLDADHQAMLIHDLTNRVLNPDATRTVDRLTHSMAQANLKITEIRDHFERQIEQSNRIQEDQRQQMQRYLDILRRRMCTAQPFESGPADDQPEGSANSSEQERPRMR